MCGEVWKFRRNTVEFTNNVTVVVIVAVVVVIAASFVVIIIVVVVVVSLSSSLLSLQTYELTSQCNTQDNTKPGTA